MPKHPFCVSCNRRLLASSNYKITIEGKTYWGLLHKRCHAGLSFGRNIMEEQLKWLVDCKNTHKRRGLEKQLEAVNTLLAKSKLPP